MELTISKLTKTYPNGVRALHQIDLTIQAGMFGLLGPNGAGKSSLMRTLATLQQPDQGQICLNGQDIRHDLPAFRRQIGYLPQDFGVYPGVSAEALLDYFARLKGLHQRNNRQIRIAQLLELVNLTAERHLHVSTFSGGMRQRFGIAQALLTEPKLLIVDEPTAGLDPAERNRFYGILHRLGERAIVLLSTHIVADVTHLCHDMAILHQGQIKARGAPTDLLSTLAGQLWQKTVAIAELPALRASHQVLATRISHGRVQAIIRAPQAPDASFSAKTADLEDYYFSFVPELTV